ncbi:MAG: hypothetical protein ICV64_11540, partial [Thermoleophilia bacterium]|nr:hypothetical protein [Thermoleophilia bacterium]
ARVAGRALRVVGRVLTAPGGVVRATCRFRLPRAAHGKRVRGSVGVAVGGRTLRRAFTFRA